MMLLHKLCNTLLSGFDLLAIDRHLLRNPLICFAISASRAASTVDRYVAIIAFTTTAAASGVPALNCTEMTLLLLSVALTRRWL